jgi:hypothetical protein
MTELEYRQHPALNYSLLKTLDFNPKLVLNRAPLESDSLLAGSVVDCLLTGTEEEFKSRFVVSDITATPTGQVLQFTEKIASLEQDTVEARQQIYKDLGIKSPATYEGFVKKWEENHGPAYLNFLKNTKDKKAVSALMYSDCKNLATSLKEHEFTAPYFNLGLDREFLNQFAIIFRVADVECKALLDKVIIDHLDKTIQPLDIKTTSEYQSNWLYSSFIKYRYDIQGAFYTNAVVSWAKEKYPDYSVLPFRFLVGSFVQVNTPMVYQMSAKDLIAGAEGGTLSSGRKLKGYKSLIEDYKWHLEQDKWDYPRAVYQNRGKILTELYL